MPPKRNNKFENKYNKYQQDHGGKKISYITLKQTDDRIREEKFQEIQSLTDLINKFSAIQDEIDNNIPIDIPEDQKRKPMELLYGLELQYYLDNKIISWNNRLFRKRIPLDKIINCLQETYGKVYKAASDLQVMVRDLREYANAYPEIRAELEHQVGLVLDMAEIGLIEYIKANDLDAIRFFLATQGADRGYTIPNGKNKKTDLKRADNSTGDVAGRLVLLLQEMKRKEKELNVNVIDVEKTS